MGQPAAKQGDRVIATDTHIILIPTPGGPVPVPTGPLSIIRNNIIDAGLCNSNYGIIEMDNAADPRFVENNDLVFQNNMNALYRDEQSNPLTLIADVNALTDTTVTNNIDDDPQITWTGNGFATIASTSPCRNAGTPTGAPLWDFQSDARPQESAPDIGPDEFVP